MFYIQLHDADGALLFTVTIEYTMQPPPGVIIYGGRYFVYDTMNHQYREGYALVVPGGAS